MTASDLLHQGRFTPAQLELLKFFATQPSETEVETLRRFFVEYYAERALDAVDRAIEERGYTLEEINGWQQEHHRTPYTAYRKYLAEQAGSE